MAAVSRVEGGPRIAYLQYVKGESPLKQRLLDSRMFTMHVLTPEQLSTQLRRGMNDFDIVVLPPGNYFLLDEKIKKYALKDPLQHFVKQRPGTIFGLCAGAMALGRDAITWHRTDIDRPTATNRTTSSHFPYHSAFCPSGIGLIPYSTMHYRPVVRRLGVATVTANNDGPFFKGTLQVPIWDSPVYICDPDGWEDGFDLLSQSTLVHVEYKSPKEEYLFPKGISCFTDIVCSFSPFTAEEGCIEEERCIYNVCKSRDGIKEGGLAEPYGGVKEGALVEIRYPLGGRAIGCTFHPECLSVEDAKCFPGDPESLEFLQGENLTAMQGLWEGMLALLARRDR